MAASQHFTFRPPDRQGLTVLHIEEAPTAEGSWLEIDTVTDIGSYPDYITEYTTDDAFDATDWFRIRWSDGKGAFTAFSQPMKGNSTTLVGEIVKRARERNRNLDINVLSQEAEVAIQGYFGENVDPYDPTLNPSYRELNGLVYLVMANTMIVTEFAGAEEVQQATLGMVSFKSSSSTRSSEKAIMGLIDLANAALHRATTLILQMEEVLPRRSGYTSTDQSRLIGWYGLE